MLDEFDWLLDCCCCCCCCCENVDEAIELLFELNEFPCGDDMSFDIMECCCDCELDDIPIRLLSDVLFIALVINALLFPDCCLMRELWPAFLCDLRTVSRTGPQAGHAGSLHLR